MFPRGPLVRAIALTAALAVAACGSGPGPDRPVGSVTPSASGPTAPTGSGAPPSGAPTSDAPPASPWATAPPFDPASIRLTLEPIATLPGRPLDIANAGDGSGRLFVVEQGGTIRIVRDGEIVGQPFLDVSSRTAAGGERGLLGLAFHPRFPDDPRLFVNYTDLAGDTVVASYAVGTPDADRVDPATETVLLRIDQPFGNHNGGGLAFGPDGYLAVATGDGGSAGDPHDNGQRLDTLLGKILRIDVDDRPAGRAYGIPTDNPFVGRGGVHPEIFLYGLRNPWRISFDRATGDLWIGDVGQGAWEEIDVLRAGSPGGANYGWARMEGFHCYPSGEGCARPELTLPVAEYGHDLGCAVTGGAVYRGSAFPVLAGGYVFSDACSGLLWVIDASRSDRQDPTIVGETGRSIAGFGEDEAGELYAADLDGAVLRVVLAGN
ncbi:MAG TPA: PQQ-dependent sugar dehydrogenase [Candidatus Limnocylindrales bacterium]|nr:PQQ-dependent sugar dehydrogenase [Candidatus Limnocylindrales bacterium]